MKKIKTYKIFHTSRPIFSEDEMIEANSKREALTLYLKGKGIKKQYVRRGNNDVEFKVYEVGFRNGEWLQDSSKKVSWYGQKYEM